jgi:hypothetical protein
MRRRIAGLLHRLAWWLDRKADDIWNIDEFLDLPVGVDENGAAIDIRVHLRQVDRRADRC